MEFGDKFKYFVEELGRAEIASIDPAQASQQGPPVDPSTIRTTRIGDRFEREPVQAPSIVALKRAQQASSSKKQKWMFKKSSYQNALEV